MRFRSDNLPLHENGMTIHAWNGEKEIYSKTYYSIGGGFIVDEEHFGKESTGDVNVPYPFKSATEMLGYCKETGLSLSGMVMQKIKTRMARAISVPSFCRSSFIFVFFISV